MNNNVCDNVSIVNLRINSNSDDDLSFNSSISVLEIRRAIWKIKQGKSYGIDGIPSELLCNDTSVYFYMYCLIYALVIVLFLPHGVSVSLTLFQNHLH